MLISRCLPAFILTGFCSSASAYFVVNSPQLNDQWASGETRMVSWTKGVDDGVNSFDIEMSRLSTDGLNLVAKNVPATSGSQKSINIVFQDVPPGDDYFLLFINSTHGTMYATSPRFSILSSGSSSNGSTTTNAKAATVTVSGAPNPTQAWATAFPPSSGSPSRLAGASALASVTIVLISSAFWTLLS